MIVDHLTNTLVPDKVKRRILSRNLSTAKCRTNPHVIEIDITFLMELGHSQNWKCALTGHPLEFTPGTSMWDGRVCNPHICTIDRIDNAFGYTKSNVQLVTWFVNKTKGCLSNDQFKQMCKNVVATCTV